MIADEIEIHQDWKKLEEEVRCEECNGVGIVRIDNPVGGAEIMVCPACRSGYREG